MSSNPNLAELIAEAAEKIKLARHLVAFTGAGISVESGIPSFRGEDGLWSRYNPKTLEIDYFIQHPEICWPVVKEIFYTHFNKALPNAAHQFLARLEGVGMLKATITQNIDSLHQQAGNRIVHCFHGNSARLTCLKCGNYYPASNDILAQVIPHCTHCGGLLKPDFIFFGEAIPDDAYRASFDAARQCDVMLVIGTTGEVYPAALIPQEAKANGAFIIEINPLQSHFSHQTTLLQLPMKAGEAAQAIAARLKLKID